MAHGSWMRLLRSGVKGENRATRDGYCKDRFRVNEPELLFHESTAT